MTSSRISSLATADSHPDMEGGKQASHLTSYIIGFAMAMFLTFASFWASETSQIWAPAVPIALSVLAVAQMGIHLVFFLRLSSSPDNANSFLALAFGLLIVILVVAGSLWIVSNLNSNMAPMNDVSERGSESRVSERVGDHG